MVVGKPAVVEVGAEDDVVAWRILGPCVLQEQLELLNWNNDDTKCRKLELKGGS